MAKKYSFDCKFKSETDKNECRKIVKDIKDNVGMDSPDIMLYALRLYKKHLNEGGFYEIL